MPCWIWPKGWGGISTYRRKTGVLPCTFAMGQKSCTKVLRPWDDWIFAVILFSMFSAAVNQAPINMCILAEKQSPNSRFGCCKPSLVKLYLFANEKSQSALIFFRLRLTFFHCPPQFRRARHPPRGPGMRGYPEQPIQQVHCCRDVKRERGSILKRNILRF